MNISGHRVCPANQGGMFLSYPIQLHSQPQSTREHIPVSSSGDATWFPLWNYQKTSCVVTILSLSVRQWIYIFPILRLLRILFPKLRLFRRWHWYGSCESWSVWSAWETIERWNCWEWLFASRSIIVLTTMSMGHRENGVAINLPSRFVQEP